jgi:tetratricopeptide (TPR) repeat protein
MQRPKKKRVRPLSKKALTLFREAILIFERGNLEASLELAEKAAYVSQNHPETLAFLGGLYLEIGSVSRGLECLKEAHLKDIKNLALKKRLADAYCLSRDYKNAISLYQGLVSIETENSSLLINFGVALAGLGKTDEASEILRRFMSGPQQPLENILNLALLAKQLGENEKFIFFLREAILIDPNQGEVFYNLAISKKFSKTDGDLVVIEKAKERSVPDSESHMFFSFALSKVYEDCGFVDAAMVNLNQANLQWRKKIKYNAEIDTKISVKIAEVFSSDFLAIDRPQGPRDTSVTPIFIVGMPRSGTTLVEQIISSHSKVFGCGELSLLQTLAADLKIDQFFLKKQGLKLTFPDSILKLTSIQLQELGQNYLSQLPEGSSNYVYITDKMPSNFRLLGFIRLILPNAIIIHCRRSPLDTCFSCYSTYFPYGQEFSYDFQELGRHYKNYINLMSHWRRNFGKSILDLDYEKLIENTKEETERLLSFCGLPWENQCLDFYKSKRHVETASSLQVRQPIYKTSVSRWLKFKPYLGPLIDELGPLAGS